MRRHRIIALSPLECPFEAQQHVEHLQHLVQHRSKVHVHMCAHRVHGVGCKEIPEAIISYV